MVILLASCGSPYDECDERPFSLVTNTNLRVAPGPELVGVMWERTNLAPFSIERRGAFVFADGTTSEDIELSTHKERGTAGTSSVLWHGGAQQQPFYWGDRDAYDVTLHSGGISQPISFSPGLTLSTAIFDGQRYQLFWRAANGNVHHQSIDEDGILGPTHDLGAPSGGDITALFASSDRAGTTYLLLNQDAFVVDTTDGATTRIWTAQPNRYPTHTFVFADKWYVLESGGAGNPTLWAVDPATTIATAHELDFEYEPSGFHPGTTSLFVYATVWTYELNEALEQIAMHPRAQVVAFGNDRLFEASTPPDTLALEAGSLALVREGAMPWRITIVKDSPLHDPCADGDR
jgi:hypothetical protein